MSPGKKKVTTVPFDAVMLFGLKMNCPPGPTLTLICPLVFGGAVTVAAAELDEGEAEDEPPDGGGPGGGP